MAPDDFGFTEYSPIIHPILDRSLEFQLTNLVLRQNAVKFLPL